VLAAGLATTLAKDPALHDYKKWENAILNYEKQDAAHPPPQGAVLFIGSSGILLWKTLAEDFPELKVINRGFGGSQIKDATYYSERVVFPYKPSAIVFRSGGNDIHAGWPAEQVAADFKVFVATVRARLPGIPIYYIGLNPCIDRKDEIPEGNKMNDAIEAFCKTEKGLTFIDTRTMTLDDKGELRKDVFVDDMLHLNAEGYRLLKVRVRAALLPQK
jgi:lysophospholipase L1-like esterase